MIGFVPCGTGKESPLFRDRYFPVRITTIEFSRHFVALSNCACRYLGSPSEFRDVPDTRATFSQAPLPGLSSMVRLQGLPGYKLKIPLVCSM
jgi:hypothetical protein